MSRLIYYDFYCQVQLKEQNQAMLKMSSDKYESHFKMKWISFQNERPRNFSYKMELRITLILHSSPAVALNMIIVQDIFIAVNSITTDIFIYFYFYKI